ncbi:MAG TPA: hypothetical protein VEJ23_04845 [Solirubrobacteraceae bacterium]|nr:hypothetical protein [Solirubrobacteraceae bacterium]
MPVHALARALAAALLGTGAALVLVSCGASGQGLIPSANAGPLQADFEAVMREAESGDGSCAGTEAALLRTERDYGALPASVDAGLRRRLSEGISKLRDDALGACAQPHPRATVTTTTTKTIAPPKTTTTPTVPQTTSTQTTPPTTTPAPSPEGGGTLAPGSGGEESGAPGSGQGAGGSPPAAGQGNGEGAGGAGGEAGAPGGGK